jgi:hypothetical protein
VVEFALAVVHTVHGQSHIGPAAFLQDKGLISEEADDILSHVPELNYLSQIVFMLYENYGVCVVGRGPIGWTTASAVWFCRAHTHIHTHTHTHTHIGLAHTYCLCKPWCLPQRSSGVPLVLP